MADTSKIHKKPIFRPCFMSIASNNGTWIWDIGYGCVCERVCACALAYIVQFTTEYWHQQFQQALNDNGH